MSARLLVVDDNEIFGRILARVFTRDGHVVRHAVTAAEGLAAAREITPQKRRRGPGPKLDEGQRQRLVELVAQFPNATLPELRDHLGADVATSTVWRALHDLGLTLKQLRQRRSL